MKWNQISVAFLIGLLAGTFVGPFFFHTFMRHAWSREQMHQRLLKRFSNRLKLSPEQRTQVSDILNANRPKVDAIFAETRSKLTAIRQDTGEAIKKILTPEQQSKYDLLDAEMKQRMDRHFPPPAPEKP